LCYSLVYLSGDGGISKNLLRHTGLFPTAPTLVFKMTTALLVIDMQNFFYEMCTLDTIPNITKLVSSFRERSLPVIFTQHGHTQEELTPPHYGGNQLVRKWGPEGSIKRGSEEWKLIPEIAKLVGSAEISASAPDNSSIVVAKNTYDAFINTTLSMVLEEKQVRRVVICGVMTDCCCDTTGRSAFNRGYETWMVSDACASANNTQHEAGLRGFGFAFGEVFLTRDALERL
jgi:nicotinamidase-related amidase